MHATRVCVFVVMNNLASLVCAVDNYSVVLVLYTALYLDKRQAIARELDLVDLSQSDDVQRLACW